MGFLPLGDDNSTRRLTPWVVWTLLAANGAVWMLQLQHGDAFTNAWATVPLEIATGRDLEGVAEIRIEGERVGIPHYPCPAPVQATLLSAMFMHGSWMHIFGNMLYLLIFADQIEDFLGRARFLLFYIVCGIAAGLAQVWWNPQSVVPCVGASGAIAGCLGAYLVKYPRNAVHVFLFRGVVDLPAWVVLGAMDRAAGLQPGRHRVRTGHGRGVSRAHRRVRRGRGAGVRAWDRAEAARAASAATAGGEGDVVTGQPGGSDARQRRYSSRISARGHRSR